MPDNFSDKSRFVGFRCPTKLFIKLLENKDNKTKIIVSALKVYHKNKPLELMKRESLVDFLENQLVYLNQLAWEYVSENNVFNWNKYQKLWSHPLWYLGVNIREKVEELKTGIKPEGSFHHEPPYRKHLLTIFTTGEFVQKHKKGSMVKKITIDPEPSWLSNPELIKKIIERKV
jgi:hypothetical protein